MKILLVNPPRSPENSILAYASEQARRFVHKKLIGPPLGLITVAAALNNHDVMLVDLKGEYDLHPGAPGIETQIKKYVGDFQPDILGVTFIASEFPYGIEIFRAARACNPGIITVAGGLHASLCPEDFQEAPVDYLCPGQSAGMFRQLADVLEANGDTASVGGLHRRTNGRLTPNSLPAPQWNAARENFIMPRRDLLDRWKETYRVGDSPLNVTYLFTSLGCPYDCTFCSVWPQFGRKFYQRTVDSVIEELHTLHDYGNVRFADANTIVDTDTIGQLFDRIISEGIRKNFIMDIRFDTAVANPSLIEKLARGGLKVVICGFESFREEELKKYRKGASASLIEKAISIFHDNGIMLRGNYVVPADYSKDDFQALSDYASGHRVVYAGYTILTPMPGTQWYREVKNRITDHDLSKYNFFNAVLPTRLPLEEFYREVSGLWLIKKGSDVI